jgi:hypothetical protein
VAGYFVLPPGAVANESHWKKLIRDRPGRSGVQPKSPDLLACREELGKEKVTAQALRTTGIAGTSKSAQQSKPYWGAQGKGNGGHVGRRCTWGAHGKMARLAAVEVEELVQREESCVELLQWLAG